LVNEAVRDCLTEPLDLEGARDLIRRIEAGELRLHARDVAEASPLSHAILNANPYAYLDDAPLEERRTRAVMMRRTLPDADRGDLGALDPAAIARVIEDAWPEVRDPDELHDLLLTLGALPEPEVEPHRPHLAALVAAHRVHRAIVDGTHAFLAAAERISLVRAAWAGACVEGVAVA